jgi:5-methyltetrahydropteroyltriglutamate--homocysteine methyltransferase
MQRSTDRILTTHTGSLPRPLDLLHMIRAKASGVPLDEKALAARVRSGVAEIVKKQADIGIDVVNDGEFSKASFVTYARERLGGLTPREGVRRAWANSREVLAFPEFYANTLGAVNQRQMQMVCTGPITYKGKAALEADLDNLKAALRGKKVAGAFIPCISPSNIEDWNKNEHYKTDDDYVEAIGEAMRKEYKAIVDAGFMVQIDDPRLVSYYMVNPKLSIKEVRKWCEQRVELLNHALRGIPRDKIRYHTCYGINMGPRLYDMELKDIVDIILKINAGVFSFEAANPRHEHEWKVWQKVKLPDGAMLMPGVITHASVLVEHPELVAERIVRFANVVGRENVIAATDCGFATFAGSDEVHPSIVWAKFEALVQGAEIASKELWGRK